MSLENESPGRAAGASENCCCSGTCKHSNPATNPAKNQPKLTPEARACLEDMAAQLQPAGDDDLTAWSAISAARFLLRNY